MLTVEDALRFTIANRPTREKSSVHLGDSARFNKAVEQAAKEPALKDEIITHTNNFLMALRMEKIKSPLVENPKVEYHEALEYYKKTKKEYGLREIGDIVWMKFTEDGYLGVVAMANDINFNTPPSKVVYNDREGRGWKYNTSGIIIHSLGKKWDKKFVLVFPLINIPEDLKRGDVECGIGNYLIDRGVPILDYYSHMF